MIKILIADDHPVFRAGLKQTLVSNSENLLIDVDEACNGQEVLHKVWQKDFDLVFLDISMPGRNGLEVLEQLKKARQHIRVLIMSMYSEDQYAVRAMKAGADGYLTKDGDPEDLMLALKSVLSGRKHFSAEVVEQLVMELQNEGAKKLHDLLSSREFEVMRMIATGKRLKQIADELSISLSTASTHRLRILRKMNMDSNADLIRYALKEQLID